MELKFTNHAKYRILERKIKMTDIKSVLKNPDYRANVFDNKIRARKSFSKYTLEIVYTNISQNKNKILIVTAYTL